MNDDMICLAVNVNSSSVSQGDFCNVSVRMSQWEVEFALIFLFGATVDVRQPFGGLIDNPTGSCL
jgi:hypothetical protein